MRITYHSVAAASAALGLFLLAAAPSHAQIVVDQSQLSDAAYMAGFSQTDLAQSFISSLGNITGASVKLESGVGDGLAGNITIALYNNLPNASGTLLASGTALGVTAGNFAQVNFGTQTTLAANTTYYLVFSSTDNTLGIGGDTTNPYANGEVFANAGYVPFPNYDYTFQTFGNAGASAAAPEPGACALLAAGGFPAALGTIAIRRRKRS